MKQIIHGDSAEILKTLQPTDYDVIITDPPYGIGKNNIAGGSRKNPVAKLRNYGKFDWDKERRVDIVKFLVETGKPFVCFGGNYYTDVLPVSRGWVVWDKGTTGNYADFEMVWTNFDQAARMFRYMWNGMIKQVPEKRDHPTQKPLPLMKWLVENFSEQGNVILDPFAGSGSTLVACAELGRGFIGIERDKQYVAVAQRRVMGANVPLFV